MKRILLIWWPFSDFLGEFIPQLWDTKKTAWYSSQNKSVRLMLDSISLLPLLPPPSPLVVLRPYSRSQCLHQSCRRWADECVRRSTSPGLCHWRENTHTHKYYTTNELNKHCTAERVGAQHVSINTNGGFAALVNQVLKIQISFYDS